MVTSHSIRTALSVVLGAVLCIFLIPDPLAQIAAREKSQPDPVVNKEPLDALGDPLPEQALFRIGTTRLQHEGEVQAVAASADGRLLASHGRDNFIRVWDAKDARPIHKFTLPFGGPWESHSRTMANNWQRSRNLHPEERGPFVVGTWRRAGN